MNKDSSSSFNDSICVTETELPPAGLQCFSSLLLRSPATTSPQSLSAPPRPPSQRTHSELKCGTLLPRPGEVRRHLGVWSPGPSRAREPPWHCLTLTKGIELPTGSSARWAQRPPPSRLRVLPVSRGEAGGTGREEGCRDELRGSLRCLGKSRRPGLGVSVSGPGEGQAPWPPAARQSTHPQQIHVCGARRSPQRSICIV